MKKGEKILGLLMIALSIFGLAMFWSAADENTGVTTVRISPLLIALAAVAGLAMCGGLTRQGAAVSLLPAAALGWVLALATDTPLWGNALGTSWNCVTPLTLMLTLWFTAQGLWALPTAKGRRFDAKSCLLGCGMLLCSALPNASYAVRDGVYAAISTSAGTHRAATLFCMILIEIAFLAGGLSLLASAFPDGLEWSLQRLTGSTELETTGPVQAFFARIQEWTALLPDYNFAGSDAAAGTSAAGIIGAVVVLAVVILGVKLVKKAVHRRGSSAQGH